jgi:hypothetical protein
VIKRFSHILLAFVLLASTTGFTVHQHYCMGHLVETSVIHVPDSCCGEESDCCSNTSETFLLDQDYVEFVQIFDFVEFTIGLPEQELFYLTQIPQENIQLPILEALDPPDQTTVLARLQVYCL